MRVLRRWSVRILKEGDRRRAIFFCFFLLCSADPGASEVLLLALAGRVNLPQAATVVAVEGALCPVHFEAVEGKPILSSKEFG
jgi:hypothetical protein